MEKKFLSACKSGDLKTVERILSDKKSNININYKNKDGDTGINLASWKGHVQIVKRLLSVSNIDINIPDNKGLHPIHAAVQYGHNTIISLLLDHGADVNVQSNSGQTPLFMASIGGHKDTIELLMKKGGDINMTDKYWRNMLHAACMYGQTGLVPFLLQLGFHVNCQDKRGFTPMYIAACKGHDVTITSLLQEGADPGIAEDTGFTPLHHAAQNGHDKCVEILIPVSDLNKQAPGVNNNTPLIQACLLGRTKSAELFLKAGADLTIRNKDGNDALDHAAEEGHASCVTLLLQHGAQVGWDHEKSALRLARDNGHTEVVKILEDEKTRNQSKAIVASAETMTSTGGKKGANKPEQCPIYQAATAFIKAMGLDDGYFDKNYDVCFCTTCHTSRGDNLYYTRGDPPKDYGLPVGWVKLGLKIPARATVAGAMDKWHVAFHGTKVPNVEKILQTGDFLKPGEITPEGTELRPPPGHYDDREKKLAPPPGFDIYKIYLSPSIRYSGCDVYAPLWNWTDSSEKEQNLRVAFQVRIKPDTYDVGPQTIGAKTQMDPRFPNSELEWSTKRRGVTVLVGLLVKVEGLGGEPDSKMLRQAASGAAALPQPNLMKDKETRPEPLAGRKVTLMYPYTYSIAPGVDIALEAGDEVTVISEVGETALNVKIPRVKQPIIIQRNFLDL